MITGWLMRWMKVREACAYLGGISADTLYDATKRGECRVARIGAGRNMLWCEEWLDAYARSKTALAGPQLHAHRDGDADGR